MERNFKKRFKLGILLENKSIQEENQFVDGSIPKQYDHLKSKGNPVKNKESFKEITG
jgi:hypothetical protein